MTVPSAFKPFSRAVSWIFGAFVAIRNGAYNNVGFLSHDPALPVISVGGVRAGGTGKTPVTGFLARHLVSRNIPVAVVSRGYRRTERSRAVVAPGDIANWQKHGDEPAMLHRAIPGIWLGVDANRLGVIRALALQMPIGSIAILDDGFQHRKCRRLLDIVTVPASDEKDRLLPSGFLREPLTSLRRADCILVTGTDSNRHVLDNTVIRFRKLFPTHFVAGTVLRPSGWVLANGTKSTEQLPCQRPGLVCGIARPERFLESVISQGIQPVAHRFFPDHHPYHPADLSGWLPDDCDGVLTTEKDILKLSSVKFVNRVDIWYLTITLRFVDVRDENRFLGVLGDKLPH